MPGAGAEPVTGSTEVSSITTLTTARVAEMVSCFIVDVDRAVVDKDGGEVGSRSTPKMGGVRGKRGRGRGEEGEKRGQFP